MEFTYEKIRDTFENFINARYLRVDGKKMLPIEECTVRRFMQELELEPDDDDWRSRA